MQNESGSIGKNLGILCRQLNIYLNHELKKYDVTASEIMYLGSLSAKDGVTQDELVTEFCVDKAAVARTLTSLESKGLIKRLNNENDKRSKRVFLTEQAYKYRDILNTIQDKWYTEIFGDFDDEDISQFCIFLNNIVQKSINITANSLPSDCVSGRL